MKRKAEDLAEELRERLKEAEDINAPDENTERMWRGNQRKMEQLEEKLDQVTISIISEPSNDLGIEQRLQQESKQISNLRTTYSQLYRQGEKLCTGKISSKANYSGLKYCQLLAIKLDVYSAPHLYEFLVDMKARFQSNPVTADSQFDLVLGHLRKENAKKMSYVEQTFRPRNLVDLERFLVITYGQPAKLEAIYTKQLKIIGRCPWPIRAENAQSIYRLLHTVLSVVLSAESCVAYFRQTQGPDKAEKNAVSGSAYKLLSKCTAQCTRPRNDSHSGT